jgi:CheY-like chemotaxis protein
MPVMDGLTATRNVRQWEAGRPGTPHIPIIGLTASACPRTRGAGTLRPCVALTSGHTRAVTQPGDENVCLASGMDKYLQKPFKQKELMEAIGQLCAAFPAPAPGSL